jgi:hypothetical protein
MKKSLLPAVVVALLFGRPALAADKPSYTRDVKPFLEKYCTECHNDFKTKADYNLENHQGLLFGGRKGPAVVPGDVDKSVLMKTLVGRGAKQMPPRKYVQPKAAEIAKIKEWIAAGAKDDSDDKPEKKSKDEAKPETPARRE